MTLQNSGPITLNQVSIEVGNSSGSTVTMNDPKVRILAEVPSGQIAMSNFYGKAYEIVATVSNSNSIVLKGLFSLSDWTNPARIKRVVIPTGVTIGATNGTYAIAPTYSADGLAGSWKGTLILENRGSILGLGGAANSGAGGNCIWMNFPGADGQKMIVNNYGNIWGGGGGGGQGGVGGTGTYQVPYQEGPLFAMATGGAAPYMIYRNDGGYWGYSWSVYNNIFTPVLGNPYQPSFPIYSGGWYYYQGAHQGYMFGADYWAVYRISYSTAYSSGGAGGAGGRGQGYDGAAASGAAGTAGGTNAGAGGAGGTGGGYGNSGSTGSGGGYGNYGGWGPAGAAGGAAGYYILGSGSVTLNNYNSVTGRIG